MDVLAPPLTPLIEPPVPPVGSIGPMASVVGEIHGPPIPEDLRAPIDALAEGRDPQGIELTPEQYAEQFEAFKQHVLESEDYTPQQRKDFAVIFEAVEKGSLTPEDVIKRIAVAPPSAELTPEEQAQFQASLSEAKLAAETSDPAIKQEKARGIVGNIKGIYEKHPKIFMAFGGVIALILMTIFKGFKASKSQQQR